MTIPRFIQLRKSLKPMGQSRHGVTHSMEAQTHPLVGSILRLT
ncbi:hypothetical protein [uncultured Gammaproteobacteria bacterium]|nr:hypothetical protein [uncultured Gammaproteobacteria bacterium]